VSEKQPILQDAVTSKEPTLSDKKKSTRKASDQAEDRPTEPDNSDSEVSTDEVEADMEMEPIDEGMNAADSAEAAVEEIESDEAMPERPSAKDVLGRLLEKNEIILKLNKDNAEKDRQLKDLNDKWLRSVAEFENYRKRSRKEWELLKQQSKTEVILEILNIIDDFERAFSVVEDGDDEFVQGIKLIYNNLIGILDKFGVQEIESLNTPFDPNVHMAVGQVETEDVESGRVAEVIQKGYRLDDMVIRPARVIVAK
jgi:molecular chaperone GrpE